MVTQEFEQRTRQLIDSLKADEQVLAVFSRGAKRIRPELSQALTWEQTMAGLSADELEMLQLQLGPDTPRLKPEHFLAHLFGRQNEPEFAKLFDDTLRDIAITNNVFAAR